MKKIFVVLLTRASCSVHAIALLSKSRQRVFRNKCGQVVLYKLQIHLTASFFGSGPMPTPMKSQNTTIWGSGDPASAQWSQPSMFCYWHSFLGNDGYPPIKTKTCFPERIFISCQPSLKKKHLLQLGIHGKPAYCHLRKIIGEIRYHYFES